MSEQQEKIAERKRLQKIHGDVWDTHGTKGSLEFQHMSRFYFNFKEL